MFQAVLACLVLCGLSACATHSAVDHSVPAFNSIQAIPPAPETDVLAVTPEMKAFLQRYVLPYESLDTRMDLLITAVTRSGVLGFNYDNERTLTAAEAFVQRSGNCLSFANLLVALAREAGLEASFQEVQIQRQWINHDDTVILAKHINVVVSGQLYRHIIDISGRDAGPEARIRPISDQEALGLYYNNIAVDALLENRLPTAYAYTARAIQTAPDVAGLWVNMGVVLSRNNQLADATYAHQTALMVDPAENAALSNLYDIYVTQEAWDLAVEVEKKVDKYRRQNPYYLLRLSDEAMARTEYPESIKLLRTAIRKKADDHELHFALAKTQYLSGAREDARLSLQRARELAPRELLARYQAPLPDLFSQKP